MEKRWTSRPEEQKIIDMELEMLRTEEPDCLLDYLFNFGAEPEILEERDLPDLDEERKRAIDDRS
jgi:hypothetical protein